MTAVTACGAPDVAPDSATTPTEHTMKLIPHASLELARLAIEAALVEPTAACRERTGHMGT